MSTNTMMGKNVTATRNPDGSIAGLEAGGEALFADLMIIDKDIRSNWLNNASNLRNGSEVLKYITTLKSMSQFNANKVVNKDAGDINNLHDSTFIHSTTTNKGYVIECANRTATVGDSPMTADTIVRIDRCSWNGSVYAAPAVRYTVAEKDGVYDGITLQSGAGVPNAVMIGDIIHVFFCARVDSKWSLIKCEFDLATHTLSNYQICAFTHNGVAHAFDTDSIIANIESDTIDTSSAYRMVSMNATIGLDTDTGYYYSCVCLGEQTSNGIIFRSLDLETWEYYMIPAFTYPSNAQYEGACFVKGGKLYLALRQQREVDVGTETVSDYQRTAMILAKIDLSTNSIVEEEILSDSGSRPHFFSSYDGSYFMLIHNIYERDTAEIIRINEDHLHNSRVIQKMVDYINYPSIVPVASAFGYGISTTAGSTGILVSMFGIGGITQATMDTAFKTMFSIA